jgi:hypothetical protein
MGRRRLTIHQAVTKTVREMPLAWASDQTDRAVGLGPERMRRDDVFEAVMAERARVLETSSMRLLARLRGLLGQDLPNRSRPPRR